MRTNTDMTIWRKSGDGYTREHITAAMWQDVSKFIVSNNGMLNEDVAEVFIRFDQTQVAPKKGDIIAKGNIEFELTIEPEHNLKALMREHEGIRKVSTVDTCDYGSESMQHWEVTAQ